MSTTEYGLGVHLAIIARLLDGWIPDCGPSGPNVWDAPAHREAKAEAMTGAEIAIILTARDWLATSDA